MRADDALVGITDSIWSSGMQGDRGSPAVANLKEESMADRHTYSEKVQNFTGGEGLMLEVGSRDGNVFVRLFPTDAPDRALTGMVDAAFADAIADAIRTAAKTARE